MSRSLLEELPEEMADDRPAKDSPEAPRAGQQIPVQGRWCGKFVDVATKDGRRVGTARIYRDDEGAPWQTRGKLHNGTDVDARDYVLRLAPCQSLPDGWGADASFYEPFLAMRANGDA